MKTLMTVLAATALFGRLGGVCREGAVLASESDSMRLFPLVVREMALLKRWVIRRIRTTRMVIETIISMRVNAAFRGVLKSDGNGMFISFGPW